MSATLSNVRIMNDVRLQVKLMDSGVAVDWSEAVIKSLCMYSEKQKSYAGACTYTIDSDDPTILHALYPAEEQYYLGKYRIIASIEYEDDRVTYDAEAFNMVGLTEELDDETIEVEEIEVGIQVSSIDTSILTSIIAACQQATDDANTAKASANTAATNANNAASACNTAKTNAETATTNANTAATNATSKIAELDTYATELNKVKTKTQYLLQNGNRLDVMESLKSYNDIEANGKVKGTDFEFSDTEESLLDLLDAKASSSDVTDLAQKVNTLEGQVNGSINYTEGIKLLSNGTTTEAEGYNTSDYIEFTKNTPLTDGGIYFYSGNTQSALDCYFIEYDENKTFVDSWKQITDYRRLLKSQLHSNTRYVRLTFNNDVVGTIYDDSDHTILYYKAESNIGIEDDVDNIKTRVETLENDVDTLENNVDTLESNVESLTEDVEEMKVTLNGEPNFTSNVKLLSNGTTTEANGYNTSDYISFNKTSVSSDMGINVYFGNSITALDCYFIEYDENKTFVDSWKQTSAYRRITKSQLHSTTRYVRFTFCADVEGYIDDDNTRDKYYEIDYEGGLEERVEALESASTINLNSQVKTMCGLSHLLIDCGSLSANQYFENTQFPTHIKRGIAMTMLCKFDSFTGIYFGRRKDADHPTKSYKSGFIYVDATSVKYYIENDGNLSNLDEKVLRGTANHNLTISTFLQIVVEESNGRLYITLNTLGGSFSTNFESSNDNNGYMFCQPLQAITDVKISVTCTKMKSSVWLFGDSYCGFTDNRVLGALVNTYGYGNCYLNGVAGAFPSEALNDLNVALNFGTPKFVIWLVGMNGTDNDYKNSLDSLLALAEQKGFEVVATLIPSVPNYDRATRRAYLEAKNIRTIDWWGAVGKTTSWYEGYQDSDNVHPTSLGAKALATQLVIDVPEIINCGLIGGYSSEGGSDDFRP